LNATSLTKRGVAKKDEFLKIGKIKEFLGLGLTISLKKFYKCNSFFESLKNSLSNDAKLIQISPKYKKLLVSFRLMVFSTY